MAKVDQREKLLRRLTKNADDGGRAAAIDLFCCTCIYDPYAMGAGSWRAQVQACPSNSCPLYKWRPVTTNEKDED